MPVPAHYRMNEPAVTTAMAWACLRTSPSAEPGPRAAAGPRRPRRRQAGAIAAVLIGGWIVRWWRLWLSVGCRWLGKGDAVRTVLGLGLRGSRTPADPGSSKSEPEMTTWASSRSRSTNSRRRASIWACKARRSSEAACSLLVSSLKRDANSSRASECGSGKATTRLILLRGTDHGKFNWTQDTASPRCRPRTQCCFHEPRVVSQDGRGRGHASPSN